MKKIHLFAMFLFAISASAQVGINTISPTKTLDVNGETRIRTLNTISETNLDTGKIVISNSDGTLGLSSLKSLLNKDGLLVYGNGTWEKIKIGGASNLIFSGELPCGEAFGLEFMYVPSGFLNVIAKTSNITFTYTTPHNFSLTGAGAGCGPYVLTFTPSAVADFYNLSSPDGVQGTISSVPHGY